VRGRYTENAPLGTTGWFKCGGPADVMFKPADRDDLIQFLTHCPLEIPVTILGAMSNTIVRDGGVPGVTIRLGREFAGIEADGETVKAGALALDANVAQVAAEAGIGGLEFFSGIPGTIGGALRMNAGCYGSETKDVLVEANAIDRNGTVHTLTPDQMDMTYRHVGVPDDFVFIGATFKGKKDNAENVLTRMAEIKQKREASQPIREKTGGSTFANPSPAELKKANLPEDTKVWQIIDQVGGRGLTIGGALMSEKHCNFMINSGNATAADLENLGEEVRKRVGDKFGISLRWEIKRIGV
jgi:UDP-N-acetylmuramate dehydrogenase